MSARKRTGCPRMTPGKIIFVYNADNGLFNALNDWAHKFFSPETYECALCGYTYNLTRMVRRWKLFIESLDCQTEFLHRRSFHQIYPQLDVALPAILVEVGGEVRTLLTAQDIEAAENLDGLMCSVEARLAAGAPVADNLKD